MESTQIRLSDRCSKCGVTLRRQALLAMVVDAGGKTLDPCICPEGGDHDFVDESEYVPAEVSIRDSGL